MAIGDKKSVVMESDLAVPGVVATLNDKGKIPKDLLPDFSIEQVTGLKETLGKKQDTLTFDAEPAKDSANPVKSGGVYDALAQKQSTFTGLPGQLIGIGDDGAAKATVYPSNKNLFDNWYLIGGGSQQGGGQFPINRRGNVEYIGSNVHLIDRWIQSASNRPNFRGVVEPDGFRMDTTNLSSKCWFGQRFNKSSFPPGIYTLSILFDDILVSETFSLPTEGVDGKPINGVGISVSEPIEGVLQFGCFVNGYQSVLLKAVKLERGDQQTLAHQENGQWVLNEVPNYAEQYAICSQYSLATGEFVGSQHSNPNLLDNWHFIGGQFPINQRVQAEYEGAGAYFIDRWRMNTNGGKWNNDTKTLTFNGESASGMSQYVDKDQFLPYLQGKALTLSLLASSNDSISLRVTERTSGRELVAKKKQFSGEDLFSVTFTVSDNITKDIIVSIQSSIAGSAVLKAVKLELGPVQTLAHKEGDTWVLNDPPPNYALELAKCQRYYQIFPSVETIPGGVAPTGDAPIKKETFRPVMRSDITMSKFGTIDINGGTFYYADANL